MVNGKSKGSSFERELCKKLSLWVSNGTNEGVYWRSALSGGRSTVAFSKGKILGSSAGDISCIHPDGQKFLDKYFIEAKFYRDLNMAGLFFNKGTLFTFWEVAKREAAKYGKHPILIAKQNQYPALILGSNIAHSDFEFKNPIIILHQDLVIGQFDDFLAKPYTSL